MQDDWYRPEIARKELEPFMARDDILALMEYFRGEA
jgi:hypothetical protein